MILFWSSYGPYGLFSNFARTPIVVDDILYKTSEHYFQSQKFFDFRYKQMVIEANTPKEAALIARDKSMPLRKDWEEIKDRIMLITLSYKAQQWPNFRQLLINTGTESLVEESPIDWYWGWGKDHTGRNQLGKCLMQLREELLRK